MSARLGKERRTRTDDSTRNARVSIPGFRSTGSVRFESCRGELCDWSSAETKSEGRGHGHSYRIYKLLMNWKKRIDLLKLL